MVKTTPYTVNYPLDTFATSPVEEATEFIDNSIIENEWIPPRRR